MIAGRSSMGHVVDDLRLQNCEPIYAEEGPPYVMRSLAEVCQAHVLQIKRLAPIGNGAYMAGANALRDVSDKRQMVRTVFRPCKSRRPLTLTYDVASHTSFQLLHLEVLVCLVLGGRRGA